MMRLTKLYGQKTEPIQITLRLRHEMFFSRQQGLPGVL